MATDVFAGRGVPAWRGIRGPLLCAAAAFLAFLPALAGDFVWDDLAVQREHLPRLTSIRQAFFPPPDMPEWPASYYRPVVLLSYQAERAVNDVVWGAPGRPEDRLDRRRAFLPHLVTLLAHAASAAAVFLLAVRLLPQGIGAPPAGALLAGLLFALHPAHGESVAFIAGRSDSLATLLLLLALLAALRGRDRGRDAWHAVSPLLYLAALGAKEVGLAGLALLPLVFWAAGPPRGAGAGPTGGVSRVPLATLAAWGAATALYLAVRAWSTTATGDLLPSDFGAAAARALAALAFLLRKTLVPWPVEPFVGDLPGAAEAGAVLAAGAVALVAAVAALRRGRRLPLFCALWFLAACLPSLPVAYLHLAPTPVAERYLYLPSVALALGAGGFAAGVSRRRRLPAAVAGALLLVWAASCWRTAAIWATPLRLWSHVTSQTQGARFPAPWVNLGRALEAAGQTGQARQALLRAVAPGMPVDGESLGNALGRLCRLDAETGWALLEAGRWGEAQRRFSDARRSCLRAAAEAPDKPDALLNAGVAGMGEFVAGREGGGVADFALLEESCRLIEAAPPAGERAAWAARQGERCRQLAHGR
jgi:hypothetical protein